MMKAFISTKIKEGKSSRITGYDLARALAVIGMVIVNFKVVMGAGENGPAWLVWLAGIFDGRAAATFVILAGIGLSLFSQKARLAHDSDHIRQVRYILLKRALFLFVVGILYTTLWQADILHFYGIYIAISALLFTASNRQLWLSSVGLTIAFLLLIFIFDYEKGWDFSTLTYLDLWTFTGMIRHIFFNGFHPVIPWLAFVLIGMWLGRKDVRNRTIRRRIFRISVLVALVSETLSFLLTTLFPGEFGILFDTKPMPPMPLYILAGASTAIVIITLCLELTLKFNNARLLRPFIATGQLALTLYVAHVVIGMGFLEIIDRLENQTLTFALTTAFIFSALAIFFAYYWRKLFHRGPLEWIMRKVTD